MSQADAEKLFAQMFGGSNPFKDLFDQLNRANTGSVGGRNTPRTRRDPFADMFSGGLGGINVDDLFGRGMGMHGAGSSMSQIESWVQNGKQMERRTERIGDKIVVTLLENGRVVSKKEGN